MSQDNLLHENMNLLHDCLVTNHGIALWVSANH